jgi:hypothetical protein
VPLTSTARRVHISLTHKAHNSTVNLLKPYSAVAHNLLLRRTGWSAPSRVARDVPVTLWRIYWLATRHCI